MGSIPDHKLLEITSSVVQNIRKIHDLDKSERLNEAVDILQEWLQKQDHLIKKDFSREYLEKTVITCKGSVEKAKKQIDRLSTMKTLLPKFFSKTNVLELQTVLKTATLIPLPALTEDHYRPILIQVSIKNIAAENLLQYYRYSLIMCEYLKRNDYVNGFVIVYDCRDFNIFDLLTKLNTVELQQFVTILVEGYGARLKSIHTITESKAMEMVINTIKHFVSEKIANRMYVHRTIEEVFKAVPQELFPVDLGGKQKSTETLKNQWVEELSSEKHIEYVKMMFKACSDESKRHVGKFNEEYMGMPGSFRNLSVD